MPFFKSWSNRPVCVKHKLFTLCNFVVGLKYVRFKYFLLKIFGGQWYFLGRIFLVNHFKDLFAEEKFNVYQYFGSKKLGWYYNITLIARICALLGREGPWMVYWSVPQIEFDRQGGPLRVNKGQMATSCISVTSFIWRILPTNIHLNFTQIFAQISHKYLLNFHAAISI